MAFFCTVICCEAYLYILPVVSREVQSHCGPCLIFDGYAVLTLSLPPSYTVSISGREIGIAAHILVERHLAARRRFPQCLQCEPWLRSLIVVRVLHDYGIINQQYGVLARVHVHIILHGLRLSVYIPVAEAL